MYAGRRDETIISRLRFGHTGLNSTLLKIGKHNTRRLCVIVWVRKKQ